jgi:ABC-type multidrug transport system fused ATPase/permease subunit
MTLVMSTLISVARGGKLDTETAFTTIAILSMVTHPANMVMTIVPRAVAAFAGFERTQAFLLQPSLQDTRQILPGNTINELPWDQSKPAIQIHDLRIGNEQLVLQDINIDIAAGSFAIISGPTGSGKSTLLRAILGEIAPVQGSTSLSTRHIAYCAQKPWLPNGTIKKAIYGITKYSSGEQYLERWYNEVVETCCLTHDFENLPDGDQTQIGSKGLNLSGGQRQRVVRILALYHL